MKTRFDNQALYDVTMRVVLVLKKMRRPGRYVLWVVIPVFLVLVFAVTVAALIPDDAAQAMLRRWIEGRGAISFSSRVFRKTLLPGIDMEGVTITGRAKEPMFSLTPSQCVPTSCRSFTAVLG